jgi:hypothetical protein
MKFSLAAILAGLALTCAVPAQAGDGHYRYGRSGYGNHGWYGGGHGNYYRGHGGYYGGHSGWNSHFGFYLGVPLYWPRPYYYTERYPTTQVIVERQPQVYVQREPVATAPAAGTGYWYYCPESKTYYPYAQTCPSPWMQVVPQTSPQGAQ